MLRNEIRVVYSEPHTKVLIALCYQNVGYSVVKLDGQQTNQLALNGQRTLSFLLIQTRNKTIPAMVHDNHKGSKKEAALPHKSQRGIQHVTISSIAFRHTKFILHFLQDTHTHTHTHTHTFKGNRTSRQTGRSFESLLNHYTVSTASRLLKSELYKFVRQSLRGFQTFR